MNKQDAIDILHRVGIPRGGNFFALRQSDVSALLAEADVVKYRLPRNANGSRGRYFHDFVQRVAARKD